MRKSSGNRLGLLRSGKFKGCPPGGGRSGLNLVRESTINEKIYMNKYGEILRFFLI